LADALRPRIPPQPLEDEARSLVHRHGRQERVYQAMMLAAQGRDLPHHHLAAGAAQ